MDNNLKGLYCGERYYRPGTPVIDGIVSPVCYYLTEQTGSEREKKITAGLVVFSLFLLVLFF